MAITYTPEQGRIIDGTPTDADILIVAGAGSGKTFTMTRRILRLLDAGTDDEGRPIDPGSILGLTFTKKAAGELDHRVREAVIRGRSHGDLATRPTISTYDSFFQQIVREYGLLIGVDPQTQPLSPAGLHELASRVVGRRMDGLLADFRRPDPLLPGYTPKIGSFSTLVGQILSLSSQILSYMIDEDRPTFEEALADAVRWNDAFLQACARSLSRLAGQNPEDAGTATVDGADKTDETDDAGRMTYSEALVTYLNDPSGGEKNVKKYRPSKNAATQRRNEAKERGNRYVRTVGRIARLYVQARRRSAILSLAGDFQRLKRAEGMADFADFTAYALRLVRRFPSIGARYRRRYRFVFLDEYQDTSTTQARLIAGLFHPSDTALARTDGPRRSVTTAVGDPFQSIYGWRGASPSAFTLFKEDFGLDGDPQTLSMTHRNKDLVLGLANMLTVPLRQRARLGRPAGEQDAGRRLRSVPVMPLRPMRLDGQDGEDPAAGATVTAAGFAQPDQEIRAVTLWAKDQVRRLSARRPAGQPHRPLVAVLLRAKTHMDDYVSALEDEGLEVQVVGLNRVLDWPEVRDLMAVLTCVADHTAVPSLMRLLATPRYGLGSDDLRALARAADRFNGQRQYAGLVAAGLATGGETEEERAALLRAHRDDMPVLSTLIDLLLEADTVPAGLLAPLSPSARAAVVSLRRVLRDTEAAQSQGLTATIQAAVDGLGLDTDVALAHVVAHPDEAAVAPAAARTGTQAVMGLVDTYLSELLDTSSATLRGFVSWVDDQDEDIAPLASSSQEADVAVMTIHQAKGLEWPAVAVAGMSSRTFPSANTVSISHDSSSVRAVCRTWAEDPGSVPAPMRSDADILPPFPHTLRPGQDPVEALGRLDDPAVLGEEVFAPGKDEISTGVRGQDYPAWLSQQEEYGRMAHAEERRLAYVAVTRSSGDVLLTFSGHPAATQKDPDRQARVDAGKAGLFWDESYDYLLHHPGLPGPVADSTALPEKTADGTPTLAGEEQMIAVCRGPRADMTLQAFNEHVPVATTADIADRDDPLLGQLLWPARVPRRAMRVLADSARIVSAAIAEDVADGGEQDDGAQRDDDTGKSRSAANSGSQGSQDEARGSRAEVPTPLTDRARQLIAIDLREKARAAGAGADVPLVRRAGAALRGRSVPTTTLQRLVSAGRGQKDQKSAGTRNAGGTTATGMAQARDADSLLLQIVRPMPQPPNEAASLGTLFHNWVAGLLDPLTEEPLAAGIPDRGDVERQIAALGPGTGQARRLARWQKAFEASVWARRRVVAVERPYDMAFAGHRIPARLDAVFAGAVDDAPGAEQEGCYTVVDWKTGRPPRTAQERQDRLLQLDLYRVAFSRARGVPISAVDACLFYVGAPAGKRQIAADRGKSEEEILGPILADPTAALVLGEGQGDDFDEDDTLPDTLQG